MPGGETIPVFGFGLTGDPATEPGGPTLEVNQDDVVTITLHNTIGVQVWVAATGQEMVPDLDGVADGATEDLHLHRVTVQEPTCTRRRRSPGPSIRLPWASTAPWWCVRRPPGQAYDGADTAFDDEATLVLSEIDPALNNAADPAAFDMRTFAPKYSLVNGKAHPNTTPIATDAN